MQVNTAEALMRSRYSAFALGLGDYLQQSHYSKTRPSKQQGIETEQWSKTVSWIKLEVNKTTLGSETDDEGTVEFMAYFLENGQINTIKENSYFKKEDGIWYYVGFAS
jgi:SEC-C motif-containing protein